MRRITFFLALMIIWLLLTWSVEMQQVIAGAVLALVLAFVLGRAFPGETAKVFNPIRWLWFVAYAVYFAYYCIRANLDVAYRVLHPDMPIRPGIVKVQTDLETDIAKTFLANSITLTPGTLTIDIEGPDLYIHWISITSDDPGEQTGIIVKRFEGMLRRIFE